MRKTKAEIIKTQNIIIAVLAVLLAIAIGFGIYFFQSSVNIEKSFKNKIKELEVSKKNLEQKMEKSLIYAQTLDLIIKPSRQQIESETEQQSSQAEWLRNLSDTTDKTGDVKLQNIFKKITTGAPEEITKAMIEFMDYAIKSILGYLKTK